MKVPSFSPTTGENFPLTFYFLFCFFFSISYFFSSFLLSPAPPPDLGSSSFIHSLLCLLPCRSDSFRNFVDSCLQKIPQDRPTSDVLLNVRTSSCKRHQVHTSVLLLTHLLFISSSSSSIASCAESVH